MPAGRPTLYKPEFCEKLVKHMSKGYSFESFAADCGVCFDTVHEWVKVHPEFSEAKKLGIALSIKWWESLLALASAGEKKHANMTGIIFALKNKAPKMFRDKIDIEADHRIEDKSFSAFTDEEKAAILRSALDAKLKKQNTEANE